MLQHLKRNAAKAGILWTAADHKGFHSFRRSIASRMLENSIPLDTIKEILGHSGADSLKPYIAVSREGLDSCAVDVSSISLRRRELQ
ncbi:MAG: tyrosine-type recombinase/integrase [Lachnospiraceae bacterium]|nr:tyrosine-type recombinase/integrase [Lachnospiraceae bacterium]